MDMFSCAPTIGTLKIMEMYPMQVQILDGIHWLSCVV